MYKDDILDTADDVTSNTNRQADYLDRRSNDIPALRAFIRTCEKAEVSRKPAMAKLLVSPMYSKIKKEYLAEIFSHIWNKQDDDPGDEEERNEFLSADGDEAQEGTLPTCSEDSSRSSDQGSDGSSSETSEGR
jgi:hypothetical protein